ncbi:MAG: CocE/NonD family hydrolase C-terminal non-catalytic domain-containing protein, partial [Actinomycetota bacterium]
FTTAPLDETVVLVGTASADLWVNSSSGDTDLEVTLVEVRPDGSEIYIQSGWLRASRRALDDAASTELQPIHTQLQSDAEPLPEFAPDDVESAELVLARVEIFPFAHVVRPGSQIRLEVDAPGGNRAVWEFDTIAAGEAVYLGTGGDEASSLVLPVIPGVEVPATPPAPDSLRGQPSR